jgi:hypothetical protein
MGAMKQLSAMILLLTVTCFAQEPVDREVIHRIKHEAFKNSRIDHHLFQLVTFTGRG